MIGQTISRYKILEKLGEGGMGIVYKAQDTTLDRLVALKFLPPHVSATSEDKARFIQEAKAAAALAHQNICTIHGVEEQDSQTFIVMEFVEGKTLNEVKSNMPVKQAIDIGIQLADGLAAAHEKGIVHRDIKPENIIIRKDGRVQIMDFGLAKLKGASRLTKEGSTVGTAGYMSPEQIQGQDTDHRTDIFSLGVILYELIAGQSPFKGVHETAINYEIVNTDPEPLTDVKPDVAPELNAIVFECLAKEPSERTQSVAEVAKDLRHFKRESGKSRMSRVTKIRPVTSPSDELGVPVKTSTRALLPWLVSGVMTLAVVALLVVHFLSSSPEPRTVRSSVLPPDRENFFFYGNYGGPPALSPDGKRVAFVAADSSGNRFLYVRPLNALSSQRLAGTEGAIFPFWSPDSRFIGFDAQGSLKMVDGAGGAPLPICPVSNFRGGTWSPNGLIVFSPNPTAGLLMVSASGGSPSPLTTPSRERGENSHRWPWFLPDGRHFLYFARTFATGAQSEGGAIHVTSVDGKEDRILVHASSNCVFASGNLLYVREHDLVAQPFDAGSLELKGEATTVVQGIGYDQSVTRALFTASQNGILLYQTGAVKLGSRLNFYDRAGKLNGTVGDLAEYISTRVSGDGQRIAAAIFDYQAHNNSLWIFDISRNTKNRFTFSASYNQYAVWSPDGNRIVYASDQGGTYNLCLKPSSGAGSEELLLKTANDKVPLDWSPDGKNLLYSEEIKTRENLWILPMSDRKPLPFIQADFNNGGARFSPDGRWVAYTSDESGQNEVYIRSFQGDSSRWQVSLSGGGYPRWRRDGKELYYIDGSNRLTVAEIRLGATTVDVNNVHPLFEVASIAQAGDYDVTADGKKFLINVLGETQNQTPMTLIVNWDVELKKK